MGREEYGINQLTEHELAKQYEEMTERRVQLTGVNIKPEHLESLTVLESDSYKLAKRVLFECRNSLSQSLGQDAPRLSMTMHCQDNRHSYLQSHSIRAPFPLAQESAVLVLALKSSIDDTDAREKFQATFRTTLSYYIDQKYTFGYIEQAERPVFPDYYYIVEIRPKSEPIQVSSSL